MKLFFKDADYEAFERTPAKTLETRPMRLLGYCVMPNHWHLLLWPEHAGDLGAFMQKLTITHSRNWQEHRRRVGYGHIYQGRYKSFPVQSDEHYYQVARYVERNALRADLVAQAEDWRWGSLWRRVSGTPEQRERLSAGPLVSASVRGTCRCSGVTGGSWSELDGAGAALGSGGFLKAVPA